MGKHVFTIVLAVLIAAVLLLYLFTFQVRENEIAVAMTFGRVQAKTGPGLHFKLPWPIQSVAKYDERLQISEGKLESQTTGDMIAYISAFTTTWKIANVAEFHVNFEREKNALEAAQNAVNRLVGESVSAILKTRKMDDLVNAKKKPDYDALQKSICDQVNENAKPLGIVVSSVAIVRLELSDAVAGDANNRMTAERQGEASRIQEESRAEADRIREEGKSEGQIIVREAESLAESIKAEGDAKAFVAMKVLGENAEVAIFLREVQALKKILSQKTTWILTPDTVPMNLLKEQPKKTTQPEPAGKP